MKTIKWSSKKPIKEVVIGCTFIAVIIVFSIMNGFHHLYDIIIPCVLIYYIVRIMLTDE